MKREQFLKRVAEMCGPVETRAIHQLAGMPQNQRHTAARKMALEADEEALADFLVSLIDDDFIDDLAAILPRAESFDEAQKLLSRLWTRLLTMISPEARDVLYAHNQLRLMMDVKGRRASAEEVPDPQSAYQSALENARAVLAAADGDEDE
jgi:hypothetical protein